MASELDNISRLPEISFIDNMTLDDVRSQLISSFQEYYKDITGKRVTLAKADPYRLILLSCAQITYQAMMQIDKAGKMNFLKYAYGGYLDELAAHKRVTRAKPQRATVPVKWKLASERVSATPIPQGSRVTAFYDVYFETTEYNEIPAGETEIIITMMCTTEGESGNGFAPGELNVLVDPVAFIASVSNTQESFGGSGEESDADLAERTFLAPSSFSTAGPDDAYVYWAKSYSSNIGDVLPTSPPERPGVVEVRFLMDNGQIPDTATIEGMEKFLSQRSKRPLTDKVEVKAPTEHNYDITAKYFINKSDMATATQIQEAAKQAVADYKAWQSERIGRDINPDKLVALLKDAGVKRVEVTSPTYAKVNDTEVAKLGAESFEYGGLEDD